MKIPQRLILLFLCIICFVLTSAAQRPTANANTRKDSVVIPFEYKQSALYQLYTMAVIDSIIKILLKNESVTLTIEGYAHQDEGNDTITKYLSLNRALFVKTYVLGRGVDSSRIFAVNAFGKTRQLYRGTKNMGLGNCRAVIKMNYPPPKKIALDRDGDFITDSLDTCPDEYGEDINNGCPDRNVIIVPFDLEHSALHATTYKVLDSVIVVLKKNPTFTIRIEGHSYMTEGVPFLCEKLAKERADIVKRYMFSKYIAASRIDAVISAGTSRPITAGRNPGEVIRNCRAEIFLDRHDDTAK